MELKKPGKKIREICTALGDKYKIVNYDMENIIYRSINGYEFEISGIDNMKRSIDATLYINDPKLTPTTVETVEHITNLEDLSATVEERIQVYKTRVHEAQDSLRRRVVNEPPSE